MKKIITLAIALVAIVSQAASIDWGLTGKRNTFFYDSEGTKFTGSAYLVLASDVAGLTAGTFADLQTGITGKMLDSVAMSSGVYAVSDRTASSASLQRGTSYDFQLLFIDATNSKYALSSTVNGIAYLAPDDDATAISFTPTMVGAAAAAGGTTWHALSSGGDEPGPGGDDPVTPDVPEPATGALALAGVALLFRRKRA